MDGCYMIRTFHYRYMLNFHYIVDLGKIQGEESRKKKK